MSEETAQSRHDVLSAAYDKMAESSSTPAPEPAQSSSTAAPEPSSTPVPDAAPSPTPTPERARDEAGRFAKQDPAAAPEGAKKAADATAAAGQAAAGGGALTSQTPPPAPAVQSETPKPLKVPQSWTPAMRELAQKLPAEFHPLVAESLRRDGEVQKALQETSQARQMAATVQQTLAPYEGIARANGMDAMSYAGSVLQSAAVLHMGTPQQKAALVATLINGYGIDLDTINSALQNPQAPAQQQPQAPQFDPRAAIREALEQERNQQIVQEFLADPPEFYGDLEQRVLERIQYERARGTKITPRQAYDLELKYSEEHQKILAQRKAADEAKARAASTQAAVAAASSVRSQPTAAVAAQPKGRMAVLEARYDELAAGKR